MSKKNETEGQVVSDVGSANEDKKLCGIIMPIADMDGYVKGHWSQIITILERSINQAGFKPRLVSESSSAEVILNSIVQNIYDDEIVVCDVSGRNPNVMFELGMRMAFKKPVVIVKDYETNFSFDISSIKHVLYPKNLNFHEVERFIRELSEIVKETHEESQKEGYKTFLDSYARIKVASLDSTQIGMSDMLEKIFNQVQLSNSLIKNSEKLGTINNISEKSGIKSTAGLMLGAKGMSKEQFSAMLENMPSWIVQNMNDATLMYDKDTIHFEFKNISNHEFDRAEAWIKGYVGYSDLI